MMLTAIKEHGYGGRRIKIGQDYEVRSEKDRAVLLLAGLAKPKKQPAKTRVLTTDNTPLVKNRVITREEQPEEQPKEQPKEQPEEQHEEQVEKQDDGQEQVDEQTGKPRRQRRQYKRHDMVPED